jgi:glycosyltransferase involved in cell wall biosynthesis
MTNLCCIFNYAPHYRAGVYLLMEQELNCDFYFGSKVRADIKKIDYQLFKKPVKELKSIWFFNRVYWLSGAVRLVFKPYQKYLLTGETLCVSNWVMLFLAKIMGKKTYVWSHGWYGNETGLQTWLKKRYFSLVDDLFLYGDYAKQLMIKEGIPANKLHVIYNSLNYSEAVEVRKKLSRNTLFPDHFGNRNPVVIFIGRLAPVKRLDMLVEVIHGLKQRGRYVNLVLVGDGAELNKLKNLVQQYQLESQVWFYGPTYDESTIGNLLFNADCCISPGNVGLTGIHSLSYGTPVITHNNFPKQMPEFEAIVKGSTGDFFEEGNTNALQETLENWLQNHPEKTAALIAACYQRIDEFFNPNTQVEVLKKGMQL